MQNGLFGFPGVTRRFGRRFGSVADQQTAQSYLGISEVLTANKTLYVRTDGSNNNNGEEDSPTGAFLTIQAALNKTAQINTNGFILTIKVGSGTYTENISWTDAGGSGTVQLEGDTTTPGNVIVQHGSSNPFTVIGGWYTNLAIRGFQLQTTAGAGNLIDVNGGRLTINGNMTYAAATSGIHLVAQNTGLLRVNNNYTITGGGTRHLFAQQAGAIAFANSLTVTLTGTPAFSSSYVGSSSLGFIRQILSTFSGAATGTRYNAVLNSVINSAGGGANYFPGSVAGTTATGGQYA